MNVLYFVHWAMCKEFTEQKSAVSVEREVNKVEKKEPFGESERGK